MARNREREGSASDARFSVPLARIARGELEALDDASLAERAVAPIVRAVLGRSPAAKSTVYEALAPSRRALFAAWVTFGHAREDGWSRLLAEVPYLGELPDFFGELRRAFEWFEDEAMVALIEDLERVHRAHAPHGGEAPDPGATRGAAAIDTLAPLDRRYAALRSGSLGRVAARVRERAEEFLEIEDDGAAPVSTTVKSGGRAERGRPAPAGEGSREREELLRIAPELTGAIGAVARGDAEGAIGEVRAFLGGANFAPGSLGEAYQLFHDGRVADALALAGRVALPADIPPDAAARFLAVVQGFTGDCLIALGREEEALEAFRRACELDPDSVSSWTLAGLALKRGSPEAARLAIRFLPRAGPEVALMARLHQVDVGALERLASGERDG